MGTWRLKLFLYPIALWDFIMPSAQPTTIDTNTMNQIVSTSDSFFFNVITSRIFSIDEKTLADFSPPPRIVSNRASRTPKVRLHENVTDEFNFHAVSVVFNNGSNEGSGVLNSKVNGKFTALDTSSQLDRKERFDARNITDGNNTIIEVMWTTGKAASPVVDTFVFIIVRCGLFFGGIGFIFLVGIGINRARLRCRPEWYDKI